MEINRLSRGTTITVLTILIAVSACKQSSDSLSPTYQDLTEAVYASGSVLPRGEYTVTADAQGIIQQRLINEGDSIRKGQLLFVLENASAQARQQAASSVFRQSQANLQGDSPVLAELEAQVRNARTRLQNDSVNYTRFRDLYSQNATSRAEVERAELNYTVAKNNLRAQLNSLQRTRNQLKVEIETNRSQLVASQEAGQNTRVQSFVNGKVYEVYKDPGEVVRPGDQLALVGSGEHLYAQLSVDENDFGKIRPGQDVIIKADVYPDKVFKARVTKIYPKLNRVDQSFRVDAEFTGDRPASYYGLTLEANIVISENKRVLTIPKSYVFGNDSVWVEQDGEQKKIKFAKGAENFDLVEVKSGLTDKSKVIVKE